MTHLTQPTPAARVVLRGAGALGLAFAMTVVVLVVAASVVGTWT